ncbi:MAG TPA: hypothetical protein VNH11_08520 [Pirellulales bacterium]|nr:hypothetical protein [Pirellulales bacterium]
MKKPLLLTLALVVLSAGGVAVSFGARDDANDKSGSGYGSAAAKAHPAEAKAVLAAANDFWDAMMAMQATGTATFSEDLHLGSCRLLNAERALADTQEAEQAAQLAHWQRMEDIYRKIKALFDTGTKGGEPDKLAAARYYRAEAELWLVEAGGTVPGDRLK